MPLMYLGDGYEPREHFFMSDMHGDSDDLNEELVNGMGEEDKNTSTTGVTSYLIENNLSML